MINQAEIQKWLTTLGLERYCQAFFENEIFDLETVQQLTDADLVAMGLPIGPRRKVLGAALSLKGASAHSSPHTASEREVVMSNEQDLPASVVNCPWLLPEADISLDLEIGRGFFSTVYRGRVSGEVCQCQCVISYDTACCCEGTKPTELP